MTLGDPPYEQKYQSYAGILAAEPHLALNPIGMKS